MLSELTTQTNELLDMPRLCDIEGGRQFVYVFVCVHG